MALGGKGGSCSPGLSVPIRAMRRSSTLPLMTARARPGGYRLNATGQAAPSADAASVRKSYAGHSGPVRDEGLPLAVEGLELWGHGLS